LPENEASIDLWRNTIQLFHKSSRFTGPFKALNFKYVVESPMLTRANGVDKRPDVIASSESGWFVLDLTTQLNSKGPKMEEYRAVDPSYLGQYDLHAQTSEPDLIISRLQPVNDGDYCQIIVKDTLQVLKSQFLNNIALKSKLEECNGLAINKLPDISIDLVPELKSQDIRLGLTNIVLQLFAPGCKGKTLMEIVDEGLGVLHDKVSVLEKHRLRDKVKDQLSLLIEEYLSGYIVFDGQVYKATEKFSDHPRIKEFIGIKLKEWSSQGQTTLSEYPHFHHHE
jgi:hypothetical protein